MTAEGQHKGKIAQFLGGVSLKRKLMYFIVGVSLTVATGVTLVSLVIEYDFYRDRIVEDHLTTAKMMSGDLEVSIDLGTLDNWRAEEVLSVLEGNDTIVRGAVMNESGVFIGGYPAGKYESEWIVDEAGEGGYFSRWIDVHYPLLVNGIASGEVVLRADVAELGQFLLKRLAILGALLCFAMFVAVILASKLSAFVSNPILKLASTARVITSDQNYSLREEVQNDDETGQLVGAFNQMMEQIELRNDVIKSNEERFRRYFELGVVGMGVLDENLQWIESNDRLSEIVGFDRKRLGALSFFDLLDEEPGSERRGKLKGLKDRVQNAFVDEFWIRGAGGKKIYAIVSLRSVPVGDGDSQQFILLLQDITDRKNSEQDLLDAKEKAEASSKAKDEFLSIMSHELRTPLNPIIGFGGIVKGELDDPDLVNFMDIILNSGQNLLNIIETILEYTRIERGDSSVSRDEFDYVEVCQDILDSALTATDGKVLDFEVTHNLAVDGREKPLNESRIISDKTKFKQIVLNLVSNAIKFTDAGSVKIESILEPSGSGSGWLLKMNVFDTGIGIEEEDRDKVFRPFSQIDSSLTRKFEGIGLGLAMCNKIVDLMGGEIDFISERGVGTQFWFKLPVERIEEVLPIESSSVPSIDSADKLTADSNRVLLVEDDVDNRFLAKTLLTHYGVDVVCANDGQEAVDLAQQSSFNMILMDLQMPKLNGLQATMRIREGRNENQKTPIIAMTAHASAITRDDCIEVGMDDYLAKPFKVEDFEQKLSKWIKRAD